MILNKDYFLFFFSHENDLFFFLYDDFLSMRLYFQDLILS